MWLNAAYSSFESLVIESLITPQRKVFVSCRGHDIIEVGIHGKPQKYNNRERVIPKESSCILKQRERREGRRVEVG